MVALRALEFQPIVLTKDMSPQISFLSWLMVTLRHFNFTWLCLLKTWILKKPCLVACWSNSVHLNFTLPCLLRICISQFLFWVAWWSHWRHSKFPKSCLLRICILKFSFQAAWCLQWGHLNFTKCSLRICVFKLPLLIALGAF